MILFIAECYLVTATAFISYKIANKQPLVPKYELMIISIGETNDVYNELVGDENKYYEKFGRSSESVNPRAKMLARRIIYTPIRSSVTYEERKQRLINAIMRDIKAKGKRAKPS